MNLIFLNPPPSIKSSFYYALLRTKKVQKNLKRCKTLYMIRSSVYRLYVLCHSDWCTEQLISLRSLSYISAVRCWHCIYIYI